MQIDGREAIESTSVPNLQSAGTRLKTLPMAAEVHVLASEGRGLLYDQGGPESIPSPVQGRQAPTELDAREAYSNQTAVEEGSTNRDDDIVEAATKTDTIELTEQGQKSVRRLKRKWPRLTQAQRQP